MSKKRLIFAVLTILLLFTEVMIALFVHDKFIRPYVGDVLVVICIYTFVRIFIPEKFRWLPAAIFVFASLVELVQLFNIVDLLGLGDIVFLKILVGSVFDIKDIICYAIGCAILMTFEFVKGKKTDK